MAHQSIWILMICLLTSIGFDRISVHLLLLEPMPSSQVNWSRGCFEGNAFDDVYLIPWLGLIDRTYRWFWWEGCVFTDCVPAWDIAVTRAWDRYLDGREIGVLLMDCEGEIFDVEKRRSRVTMIGQEKCSKGKSRRGISSLEIMSNMSSGMWTLAWWSSRTGYVILPFRWTEEY